MGLEAAGKFPDINGPTGPAPGFGNTKGTAVAAATRDYLGTPYKWGGNQPGGFDCSGLVQYVWEKVGGISIPHNSAQQFHMGHPVSPNQLQPGDAVFYVSDGTPQNPGHEALYIGGGYVIVAPHTGGYVQVVPLNSIPGYAGARRFTPVQPPQRTKKK